LSHLPRVLNQSVTPLRVAPPPKLIEPPTTPMVMGRLPVASSWTTRRNLWLAPVKDAERCSWSRVIAKV